MANKIQLRRGTKEQLATLGALSVAEPGYCTDTKELFIGNASGGNTPLVTATSADITYYVRTDGNDSNTGLTNTAGGAFKTIVKALSMLPKFGDHSRTINVAAGSYADELELSSFYGKGTVSLVGDTVVSTSRTLPSIKITNSGAPIIVKGFNLTKTTSDAVNVVGATDFLLAYLNITASYAGNGILVTKSKGGVQDSTISNKSYPVNVGTAGEVSLVNLTGTGNIYSSIAYGGKITLYGTQPNGSPLVLGGGLIISGEGVINPWGDNTWATRSFIRAYQAPVQSIAATTNTKVNFQVELSDNLSEYDPSISRFVAKQSGIYIIKGSVGIGNLAANNRVVVTYNVNGIENNRLFDNVIVAGNVSSTASGSDIVYLNAGQYVEVYVFSEIATTLQSLSINTVFEVIRVA
jgi:hypothetical protein